MKIDFIKKTHIEPSNWNPRKDFNEEKLKELKESIKTIGIIEPIIIRKNPIKPEYYFLTAGYQRWKTYKDNELIPCIITNESELNAKIRSISENIFRSKLSDPNREKIIYDIYQQGLKENKWKNYTEMSKETKIPIQTISTLIKAHDDRKQLGFSDHEKQPSTSDLKESRSLKDKPIVRKKLLQNRLDSKIKGSGHIVHKISKELKETTEQKDIETKIDEIIKNNTQEEEKELEQKLQMLKETLRYLKNFGRFHFNKVILSDKYLEYKRVINDIHNQAIFINYNLNRRKKYLEILKKDQDKTNENPEVTIQ